MSSTLPSVYIETTIPSYYTARLSAKLSQAAKQLETRRWWDQQSHNFRLYTSQLVLDEASLGDPTRAADRLRLLSGITLLPASDLAEQITRKLIVDKVVPLKAAVDAAHIAQAAAHGVEYLLTWNCTHIANARIAPRLRSCILQFCAQVPEISTPLTLLADPNES